MDAKVSTALLQPFGRLVKTWDSFWFTPSDPFNLCVIRLLAGAMIVYTHLIWGTHLNEFFGDEGWNSREYLSHLQGGTLTWSFWWYVPDAWKLAVHYVCMSVLVCFFVGLWTRTTSVLTWLIAVAYSTRSALSNYGLDQINCILLMYLMLAPCGHYLSIDAWLRRRKQHPTPAPSTLANVATRLIQVHLCVIYLWAGLGKLQGEAWWNGQAIWQALASYEYQSTDLTFLAAYPAFLNFMTHLTIAWEVFFPALVWNRAIRPYALALGFGMHLGIGAFLGMWTFGLAMTFGYLAFVPPHRLREILGWVMVQLRLSQAGDDNALSSDSAEANEAVDAVPDPASRGPLPWAPVLSSSTVNSQPASPPLIPFRGMVPNVVLVARENADRKHLTSYLQAHSVRLMVVDGLTEAGALASVNTESLVLVVDSKLNESELNVLCQWIRHHNPQTRFVFVGPSPYFRNDDAGTIVIERNCSLRQIRTAIEELTGCTCEDQTHRTERTSDSEEDTLAHPHALSMVKVTTGLLLACVLFLTGCQKEESTSYTLERIRLLNDNNQTDEALSVIEKMLRRDPNHPDALYQRGVAYEQRQDFEKAIEAYTECLKHAPDFAEALNNRGIVYGLIGQTEKSLEDIHAATLAKPDVSLFWSNLGLVQCKLGRFDQALDSYQRAQHRNEDIRLEFQKGNILVAAGRFTEGVTAFTEVLEKDKYHTAAWVNRAHARHQLGQDELAIEDLSSAESCDTEFTFAPHIASLKSKMGVEEASGE